MQTPTGFHVVQGALRSRAEIVDFWAMVFNPSAMIRLAHTVLGAWQAAAFLVLSVSAFYLLKRRHLDFAKASMRIGLVVALVASVASFITGYRARWWSASTSRRSWRPWRASPASARQCTSCFGWVDEEAQRFVGVSIPGMLSFLVHGDAAKPVTGLRAFPPQDRPPVNPVFQAYHAMIGIGMGLIGLSLLGAFLWWRGSLFETRWLLRVFVAAVLGPQMANQLGWFTAEVGRQPWIVYGLMRTADAGSPSVTSGQILASLGLFLLIYLALFILFIFLLDQKIRHGPLADDLDVAYHQR
jgi:cytochrome d ubiquinol oxidase subunit I